MIPQFAPISAFFMEPCLGAIQFPFGQVLEMQDLAVIALLVVLEGVLSIDNALVLGLLARKLPKSLQNRALTYGLVGAFVFRLIAIATATYLLRWWVVKLLGGGYLVYVAVKHLFFEKSVEHDPSAEAVLTGVEDGSSASANHDNDIRQHMAQFWSAVVVIELTDIAFAIDSILAAIALVAGGKVPETGFHPKLWVIVTGGFLGVVLMRFAAIIFIRLLERFPRFEMAAYLLVLVIGLKLLGDWYFNNPAYDRYRLDFHSPSSWHFWVFWILMLVCFSVGFWPQRSESKVASSGGARS